MYLLLQPQQFPLLSSVDPFLCLYTALAWNEPHGLLLVELPAKPFSLLRNYRREWKYHILVFIALSSKCLLQSLVYKPSAKIDMSSSIANWTSNLSK